IFAAQAGVKASKEWADYTSRATERRSQANFNVALEEREAKQLAVRTVNTVAGSNLEAFQSFSQAISSKMRKGELSPE
ncbi:hypothetical protein OE165_28685, partial [Escherichia coli]|uniref:hypothetical protein n=1 Tax=Escherichia coli TaxID=562 RepID=UPI0021F2EA22